MVTLRQALAVGLRRYDVENHCRAGRWHRLAPGGYLIDADLAPVVPRRAVIRAAVHSLGPRAVAVLDTAAELHGLQGLPETERVHVSVPVDQPRAQRRANGHLVVHQLTLGRGDVGVAAGIPVTTALRTAADLILRVDRFAAVSLLDSAVNRGAATPEALAGLPGLLRGRRGAVAARRYLTQVDGRAQSPLETRVRLRCVDGRVRPDQLQYAIRDTDGYLLGVADLAWRAARVVAEADGAGPHGTPEALFEDRRRQNRIANAGWRVLRFTWSDTHRPDYIPHTVRQAVAAR